MLSHYGIQTGLLMARKHLGWYSKGLMGSAEFRVAINQSTCAYKVKELITELYERNREGIL